MSPIHHLFTQLNISSLLIRYSLLILWLLSTSMSFAQNHIILRAGTKNTGQENVRIGVFAGNANQAGNGQVSFSTNELATGTYIYHLVIDGRQEASKKIVVVK